MRRGSDALETINAAANVIASGDNRVLRPPKRRWGSCWSLYWCFGTHKTKKVGHAALVPEPTTTTEPNVSEPERQLLPPSVAIPFAAPPSSPVSFIPSENPSTTQSPTHVLSLSVSANMYSYSPSGPASMFAVGPYAHERQLVSPPVFSTFTTEPSTAPYTPPPESTHAMQMNPTAAAATTAPPSPEVPFARLLEPGSGPRYPISQYEFQSSYQLQPGSPMSHLISPISNSGTSSPFLDREITPFFLGEILRRGFGGSGQELGDAGPLVEGCSLDRQDSDVGPLRDKNRKHVVVEDDETSHGDDADEMERQYQKSRTITLGSTKEFNFDTVDGVVSSDGWWANERISVEEDDGKCNDSWTFFPVIQTGVS